MTRTPIRLSLAALALAFVVSPAAAQGTQEQQDACAPDAFKLCQNTIPDIPKTEACMRAHFAQLSPRCQHVFKDVTGGSSQRPKRDVARGEAAPPPPAAQAPRGDEDMATIPLDPLGGLDGSDDAARSADRAPAGDASGPLADYANQIRAECREGLIDPFTCRNTLAAIRNAE